MPSIAIVVNAFPRLSESFIANKVRFLADAGYRVTVIAHDLRADQAEAPWPETLRIKVAPSAYRLVWRLALVAAAWMRAPGELMRLWRALAGVGFGERVRLAALYAPFAGERFDVTHFAFSGLGIAYQPILSFLKKKSKLYVSCRGHAEQVRPLSDPARRGALERLFATIDRVHCVSDNMLDTCRGYGLSPDKAFVNRPAIDPALFCVGEGKEQGRARERGKGMRIASVGRLHWKKGQDTLLQALQILAQRGIDAQLDIAGEGPEREKLLFVTHLLGLSGRVRFRGALSQADVRQLLAEADIYAHASLSEGISNAVMEAMAMELPVVSTEAGGMRELIAHGRDGLLVPPLNPGALADALQTFCEDPDLRSRLGSAARQTILRDFTLERQLRVYAEEYAHTLAHTPHPDPTPPPMP